MEDNQVIYFQNPKDKSKYLIMNKFTFENVIKKYEGFVYRIANPKFERTEVVGVLLDKYVIVQVEPSSELTPAKNIKGIRYSDSKEVEQC